MVEKLLTPRLCGCRQVDVFDVAYSRMCDKITASTDFESVRRAHAEFLSNVTVHSYLRDRVRSLCQLLLKPRQCAGASRRCLVLSQTRRASIMKMLQLAMDFTALVDRVSLDPKAKIPLEAPRLASLDKVRVRCGR